ncbi:MAG: MipA/OmpV family protein [Deltaproteobacteria bacterium]|nr:MipA/OmpV family protein [Deltaproteobacteria bacterium]
MRHTIFTVFFIGLACIVFDGASIAAPPQRQDQPSVQGEDWSVRIGALGFYKPAYEGSDDYELRGFPLVDITWRDTIFLNAHTGLGAYVWNRNNCKLGLAVGYTFGRDEDDSADLRGLGDIDDGATASVLFRWAAGDAALHARYEQQITGQDTGFQVNLGLGYELRIAEKTTVKPSIQTTYASSDYMEEYFGISPGQSSRSGIRVYDADSGFKSLGFQIMAIYRLDQHWGIQAGAVYDRLVGEAADSPVVKNENQYRVSTGLSYTF